MYSWLYQCVRLFGKGGFKLQKYLYELERTQWLSKLELRSRQFKRIQKLLTYAYENVPFYRSLYKSQDIHPHDIQSFKDFHGLPYLSREDVKNNLDRLVSQEFHGKIYLSHSGGSTGKPISFYTESSSSLWGGAIRVRGRRWYGIKQGQKIAKVTGILRDLPGPGWTAQFKNKVKRQRFLNDFITEATMSSFAKMLLYWKPALIRGQPSVLSIFAKYLKDHEISHISPNLIETTSEKLLLSQRKLFEEVFNCQVADCYGSRELYEIAYQCPAGGFHVCEPVYLEIVNDEQVLQPGPAGEVVITSLTKFAMPFIRYKIGDMASYDLSDCSCGRKLPCLKEIIGRKTDFIVCPDGKYIPGITFDLLFRTKPEVIQFQVIQKDINNLDVKMVCKQNIDSLWKENVHKELQSRLGQNIKIKISLVDHIELMPSGKHHYVISEIDSNSITHTNPL